MLKQLKESIFDSFCPTAGTQLVATNCSLIASVCPAPDRLMFVENKRRSGGFHINPMCTYT